ncbi:MAG: fatty-acyl-CoA synthase [Kiritimatiellia bacterium]|jgi:fatty-acyl-CoA synthase|tara:strand:- start:8833 stop:9147 length:315 start_codon:yes stop_codon:yes gene_type:complete
MVTPHHGSANSCRGLTCPENSAYVSAAAVVAAPHAKWGETPHAFIETVPEMNVRSSEIIAFCRDCLAHFKCPTRVTIQELPKTATGKIQKYELREKARAEEAGQ